VWLVNIAQNSRAALSTRPFYTGHPYMLVIHTMLVIARLASHMRMLKLEWVGQVGVCKECGGWIYKPNHWYSAPRGVHGLY
jgi:hypothetical protein